MQFNGDDHRNQTIQEQLAGVRGAQRRRFFAVRCSGLLGAAPPAVGCVARGLPIIGAFDNPRPAGINDLIPDCDRTNSLALSRNLEPNVTQYLV